MPSTIGRIVVGSFTNKSGGALAKGDVVVLDSANDNAVTTITASASTLSVGVVIEDNGIANNAAGRVQFGGYVALVNVNASVTRGHYAETHTVAKQATGNATRRAGSFATFTTGGATPSAWLFGIVDTGGGSGAPTTSTYITGSTDGGLSAEKVKAALYKNYDPDEYPTSGTAAATDEFDDGSLNGAWSWTTGGPTTDESTYPGILHVDSAKNVINKLVRAYVPGASTAFSIAAKVALTVRNQDASAWTWGIAAFDSSNNTLCQIYAQTAGSTPAVEITRIFGTGGTGITINTSFSQWIYFAITRDASDVYVSYYSLNGLNWIRFGTTTVATAVAKVGFIIPTNDNAGNNRQATADFFRVFTSATTKIGA